MRRGLILLLGSIALAGCHKSGPVPASSAGATAPLSVLRVGNGSEPQELDPQAMQGSVEHRLAMALFEGLLTEDPVDLHPVPGVAQSWEISADGLSYRFHLRPNAQWSDGEPLTADDYVASYRRMLSPRMASEYAYLLYNFIAGADDYYHGKITDFGQVGVHAIDPHTLLVQLANPTPFLLRIIACHNAWDVVPTKVIARYGPPEARGTGWSKHLVSNGPYRLKQWLPGEKIVVERNPHYWNNAATKLDQIEFYPIDDIAAEERMFRTGQLDVTYEMPRAKVEVYRKSHPDQLFESAYLGTYFYRFNCKRAPFTDARVRRALALAIDRERIVRDVTKGGEEPAYAVSYPGTAGYFPHAKLVGGVAEARQLLAAAGFPDGRGFPSITLLYNTQQMHREVAEAIQAMWQRNLGITIQLRNEEWKVYLDAQHTHDYDLERAGWVADYVDPHVFLEIWETGNGNNDSQWSNPEYDRLLHRALAARTDAARYAIYQRMDEILVEECPVLPLFYYTRVYLKSPRVTGWTPTLLDDHPWQSVGLR
jgi:oligopeptide transport system substrate-binding protein